MSSLDSVSIAIFLGAVLVMAGILSSLLALRFGAPLLLVRPDLHVVWRGTELPDAEMLAARATGHTVPSLRAPQMAQAG